MFPILAAPFCSLACLCVLSVLFGAVSLAGPALYDQPEPEPVSLPSPIPLELRDTLWQTLPNSVGHVYVGPDDRAWFELRDRYLGQSPDEQVKAARALIQREFQKPAPQLWGVLPALFEPDGRVWFNVEYARALLAYDGKNWIEHRANPRIAQTGFTGAVPGHGDQYSGRQNLLVAGTRFFPDACGIHTFDGQRWSYQLVFSEKPKQFDVIRLEPEADGKGVLVLARRDNSASIWRWRDGTWREIPLDGKVYAVASDGAGALVLTEYHRLQHVDFDAREPADWMALRAQLSSPSPAARQAALERIEALGRAALPYLSRALDEPTASADELRHFRTLRDRLRGLPPRGRFDPNPSRFGEFLVAGVHELLNEPGGGLLIVAEQISKPAQVDPFKNELVDPPPDPEPGILYRHPDGSVQVAHGESLIEFWRPRIHGDTGPLFVSPGVWWIGGDLLDMSVGRFIQSLPQPGYRRTLARQRSGRLFVLNMQAQAPVVAFTPRAPDQRKLLNATEGILLGQTNHETSVCIASDGSAWTLNVKGELIRFDGKQWHTVAHLADQHGQRPHLAGLLPGHGGHVLVDLAGTCVLASARGEIDRGELRTLIERHTDIFKTAFAAPNRSARYDRVHQIAADSFGQIWLLDGRRKISVYANGKWLDATAAMEAAGAMKKSLDFLIPLGSRVYYQTSNVNGSIDASFNAGFLAELKNGQFTFTPSAAAVDRSVSLSVIDDQGGLWIPGRSYPAHTSLVSRITDHGTTATLEKEGWPRLVDRSGNVWLGPTEFVNDWRFAVVRDANVIQRFDIPGANNTSTLFSDKPGSVWAWTTAGMHHLTAGPDATYALRETFHFAGLDRQPIHVDQSPLGFFILLTIGIPGHQTSLHIAPFPATP